jgi:hypothetical protein
MELRVTMSVLNHACAAGESGQNVSEPETTETRERKAAPRARRKGAQPLQSLLEECLEPSLRAKGFASSAIHLHWDEIVGAQLGPWSEPVSLRWPPRPPGADPAKSRDGATLTIKIEGAFALDLQHQTPQIINRINGFFGWRCVEKLVLKQGSVRKVAPPTRRLKPVLSVEGSRALDHLLTDVESPELKAALARLGVGVMGKR